ncbi:MAG: 30S ribosomal protein S6 [candidate division Zixibacteria bacterium]
MRLYELTVIFDASLDESTLTAEIEKIEKHIKTSGAKIHKLDRWGNKRLAYEINKQHQGYYVFFLFDADPGLNTEIERTMRLNENILRFLTVAAQGEAPVAEKKKPAEETAETDQAESVQE